MKAITHKIIIDIEHLSNNKANDITKKMLLALNVEELDLIKQCKVEHVMFEITKMA